MSLTCSQCSHVNPDQSAFCVKCGNRFQTVEQIVPTFQSAPPPSYAASLSAPLAPPPYSAPPSSSFPPPYPTGPQQWQSSAPTPSLYPAQMGTGQAQFSIRRAFAGRGTLIGHNSWLLNGKQVQAATVLTTILDILRQRNISGLSITPERLTERGILIEERDYLTTHRSVATVFTYVAPAGQDLYISRATTVLPAISNVRIIFFSALAVVMLIGFITRPSSTSLLSGDTTSFVIASLFSILSIPLLLFFIGLLIRSFIHWLVEKDFWVYLRPNTLNDFQLDDIALLEHATDDTVRTAVERLGLDASQIVPPTQGYQPKQRIRII